MTRRSAAPAPNTLYAGAPSDTAPTVALLTYRLYVPTDPSDQTGGVPYPVISTDSSSGTTVDSPGACASEPIPALASVLIVLGWEEYDDSSPLPGVPQQAVSGATSPPTWARQFGSVLGNPQNAYLASTLSSQYGQLAVIRLRTPSFPDNRAGQPVYGKHQLRYWSFCTYDSGGNTVFGCVADYNAVIEHGWTTYVISTSADRPAEATSAQGVNWLPWGLSEGVQVVYRNMLPSASFRYAAQAITSPTQEVAQALGPYYPEIGYCSEATFEAGGWSACVGAAR